MEARLTARGTARPNGHGRRRREIAEAREHCSENRRKKKSSEKNKSISFLCAILAVALCSMQGLPSSAPPSGGAEGVGVSGVKVSALDARRALEEEIWQLLQEVSAGVVCACSR
jgi:hypothetical protein